MIVKCQRRRYVSDCQTVSGGLPVGRVAGLVLCLLIGICAGSEHPERECCDPVYPPITDETSLAPVTQIVPKASLSTKPTIAILNCLMARQFCFEDASCSAILEIIPRVCGSELVACSTVTVTKCQAALKTLQAFPFFKPTCLCREPNLDPECNSFRDFLFDHPCVFVMKKEKDPYPVETLPTCTYALSVCHGEPHCQKIFDRFKSACRVREGECRMDDRDACKEAWAGLRMSPLFGCICPNNHMKKRCDKIFSVVNHNPCVEPTCPPSVMSLFKSEISKQAQMGLTRYIAPDGSLLLLTEDGTRLLTRTAAAELLRHALSAKPNLKTKYERVGPGMVRNSSSKHDIDRNAVPEEVLRLLKMYWSTHIHFSSHQPDPGGESLGINMIIKPENKEGKQIGQTNGRFEDDSRGKLNLQSTCHKALTTCLQTETCAAALTPVLKRCDTNTCDREGCMMALRDFYGRVNVKWNQEIAFCLCKKTSSTSDDCVSAQERLHPVCAQKPPSGDPVPACHNLAQTCREDSDCRTRLENYEQWCAVDAVTHGCAGSPANCRQAVMAALGTDLRATCACRDAEVPHLYECLGWQRLLWLNPCVVESQSDFHIKTYNITYETTPLSSTFGVTTVPEKPFKPSTRLEVKPTDIVEVKQKIKETTSAKPSEHTFSPEELIEPTATTAITVATTTTLAPTTTIRTTTPSTTTVRTTTIRTTTTADPSKYCIVQWEDHLDQFIKMGETKRLYRAAPLSECTEVCACDTGLRVSCQAACVPRAPCSSRLAHYAHAAPAYRAYRGRCYCYSGAFICMRPDPVEYKLPTGVYLLLGYSSVDESLLRPHTGLGVEDSVRVLQDYMETLTEDEIECTLSLFNTSSENIIISANARKEYNESSNVNEQLLLDREKEACIDLLSEIKTRINSQHSDIISHLLLSIFKIAEVEVIYPAQISKASRQTNTSPLCLFVAAIFVLNYIIHEFNFKKRFYILDVDSLDRTIYNKKQNVVAQYAYEINYTLNVRNALSFCNLMKLIHIEKAVKETIFCCNTLLYFSKLFQMLFEKVIFDVKCNRVPYLWFSLGNINNAEQIIK